MEAEYSAGPCDFCLKYCSVAKKSRYKLGWVCEEKIPALKKMSMHPIPTRKWDNDYIRLIHSLVSATSAFFHTRIQIEWTERSHKAIQ